MKELSQKPVSSGQTAEPNVATGEDNTPAASGTPILQVKNLTKSFDGANAVNDISFDVHEGEFLFLIGPSGCGKTTTLRMIGGYETPTSGEIFVRGEVINHVPLDKRNLGMVFQSYALFPHMTVSQNVEYGLKTRKVPRAERKERIKNALDLVELSHLGNRYPSQLSGGQRQRVALARVIVYEPDILLLDEPLANLDKRLRDVMRVELRKLQRRIGITTLYVTHDQEEALAMADRIAVMHEGNILQIGTPRELYNCPADSFVATFLGETSSFSGLVESIDGDKAYVTMQEGFTSAVHHNGDLSTGDRVTISIRPERVSLTCERLGRTENIFEGVVDFVEYQGAFAIYQIEFSNGRARIEAIEPIPSGKNSFDVGERIFASWETDNVVYVRN